MHHPEWRKLLNAKLYRARAEECLRIAELMTSIEARAQLLRVADTYTKLTNEAEQRALTWQLR
jgi:cytochrome c biogenesis factor